MKGHFKKFGPVWYYKDISVNILSQSALVDLGCKVIYDDTDDGYIVQPVCKQFFIHFYQKNVSETTFNEFDNVTVICIIIHDFVFH
jgi:hypothetical protein